MRVDRRAVAAGALGCAVLVGSAWMPRAAGAPAVHASILVAGLGLSAWLAALVLAARKGRRTLEARSGIRAPHLVQLCCHSSIYVYWAMYEPIVAPELPLIGAQVGFGPIPIVFSTNLFLWFKDDGYGLQLVTVALALLSREYLRWRRDGQSTHIFNPSAAGLAVVSIALIATRTWSHTWGAEVATTLENAPYMFDLIFLTGVVVHVLFGVGLMTMSAGLSMWAIGAAYHVATGNYFFTHTTIPIAVFLGMTLLFTDPATSPRSKTGRALFGVGYSVLVFAFFVGLEAIGAPAFFDKLLPVPILNLLVPLFDRVGREVDQRLPRVRLSQRALNYALAGLWVVGYGAMRPGLVDHPGSHPEIWRTACAAGKRYGCLNLVLVQSVHCQRHEADACQELADFFGDESNLEYDAQAAADYRRLACEAGREASCARPAAATATGDREPRCLGGEAQACADLAAEAIAGSGDFARAAEYYRRACDGGLALACANLGLFQLQGRGVPLDKPAGFALHQRACSLGLAVACGRVGRLYEVGEGVAADAVQARAFYERACGMGDRGSCIHAH
jgi:hypothetical protein